MQCTTNKPGIDCLFMTNQGCGYNGGSCHSIVEQCEGCNNVITYVTGQYCRTYSDPPVKWIDTRCNFATHNRIEAREERKKLNPLKASKRSRGK
ncbi:MAG: hypothetical protein HYY20_07115 [Candidatus Tectomicrobia bacterium]|uniref:Uncharacterized protein n=1 Tax=Tectimicrobiota bacterium TaxID=2528274 RepID=A0A932CNG0_UNCTE|nr:hypothetical protein [Candidatus Tectomicrobia bacterium]